MDMSILFVEDRITESPMGLRISRAINEMGLEEMSFASLSFYGVGAHLVVI